jgi:5'-deoxynucleotidase YfbR-like HD superfamily hydrolase
MEARRDISFLYEVGTLRHVARTWKQFGGLDMSNVAEHSFRVAWISLVLATRENADVGRCLEIALIHDLPEARTGDVNYMHRIHTVRNEDSALADALEDTAAKARLWDAWHEWSKRETLEARIVYDADNLDCDFELREQEDRGSRLPGKLAPTRDAVRMKLYTDSARQMFDDVKNSDPHDWHLASRNRLTAGDWAKASHS